MADPEAGVADDFQFKAGARRHAIQVKWSQYPGAFTWAMLVNSRHNDQALITKLAESWKKIRSGWTGPLTIHLCTNDSPSRDSPNSGTPLHGVAAARPKSFAAFVARSFEPVRIRLLEDGTADWQSLSQTPEVTDWQTAWAAIKDASGLGDDDFVAFLRDFSMSFAVEPNGMLFRDDETRTDAELRHIASTLQAIVADPAQIVELTREQLLDRLGWADRIRYRNPHRFPVPAIYTANEAARLALERQLTNLDGGYLALVGPAGCGKSTLLASLNLSALVVRYYSFIPDAPDPLSGRGEADSFLHDISLALEETGLYRKGYGNDLRTQRAVLLAQLEAAGRRYAERGERTVVIVDGLDHVPREQNPARSFLEELPSPAALPDGVFLVLGTQTTAILPPPISQALSAEIRTINVPPLRADEVRELAVAAGPGTWLRPAQLESLVESSEGHPLALTYAIQELVKLEAIEPTGPRQDAAGAVLADASAYGGDVDKRYRGYLLAAASDDQLMNLLAVIARLRGPVDLDWLASWNADPLMRSFVERTGIFFHRNGRVWRFIHNSFRRFLTEQTAQLDGHYSLPMDRDLHARLADICATTTWTRYKDEELAHRFLAGQLDKVLSRATPSALRNSLLNIRPIEVVRDHASLALRAAAVKQDYVSFLRLLLFISELTQREQVLEPEKLAEIAIAISPSEGIDHVVQGVRLRASSSAALKQAANLVRSGQIEAGEQILRATGGLSGLLERSNVYDLRHLPEDIANWAEAIFQRSGLARTLDELDHLLPSPTAANASTESSDAGAGAVEHAVRRRRDDARERQRSVVQCRAAAHARCFDLLLQARDSDSIVLLLTAIDAEASVAWRARAREAAALTAVDDGATDEVLRLAREVIDLNTSGSPVADDDEEQATSAVPLSLRLQAAHALVESGLMDAPEVDLLVPQGTRVVWPTLMSSGDGLDPYFSVLSLRRLRVVRPDAGLRDNLVSMSRDVDAGVVRMRTALEVLAQLEGEHILATNGQGIAPLVVGRADPVLRLFEVPTRETRGWLGWSAARDAFPELLERLVVLTFRSAGPEGLAKLCGKLEEAWKSTERRKYWPISDQQAVLAAVEKASPSARGWVVEWMNQLDAEISQRSYDQHGRVENWLSQAKAWARIGDTSSALGAAQAAVQASYNPGYHDEDRQLSQFLEWLSVAIGHQTMSSAAGLETLGKFAARLEQAASEAEVDAEQAAGRLAEITFAEAPEFACAIADWLCEAGVIAEQDVIAAIVLSAARSAIPLGLTAAIAANMLLPILRHPPAEVLEAIRLRDTANEYTNILEKAVRIWEPRDRLSPGGGNSSSLAAEEPEDNSRAGSPATKPPAAANAGALLSHMRAMTSLDSQAGDVWAKTIEDIGRTPVARLTALSLLAEAERLGLAGAALSQLVMLAAHSGAAEEAISVLAGALSRTPPYGWRVQTDGGSRLKLFSALETNPHPRIQQFAAEDLAAVIAGGALRGTFTLSDIDNIARLLVGSEGIAQAWPDIELHLDLVAPVNHAASPPTPMSEPDPETAILRWVVTYLGHPVRPLDFGARQVLQEALRVSSTKAQAVIAEALAQGGWTAEAALLSIVTLPVADRPPLSTQLITAISQVSTGPDAICRALAGTLAEQYGLELPQTQARELAVGYTLELPPTPPRRVPELDAEGVPHIDYSDPRQVVAPFDVPIKQLAQLCDLDPATVLYRAAVMAEANSEPWTAGKHRAFFLRLKRRGLRLGYRPWAYMAGRRALGTVMAELCDANLIGDGKLDLPYRMDFIEEVLMRVDEQPLDTSTPLPWRVPGTSTYDIRGWCDEAQQAADHYAQEMARSEHHLLAEKSDWCTLAHEKPEETRKLQSIHGVTASDLILPDLDGWELSVTSSTRYPRNPDLTWDSEQLVVHGMFAGDDPRWTEWLALHPAVAQRLNWFPDQDEPFSWQGEDGLWRARSIRYALGQVTHQPPLGEASCAEGWQVVLSPAGHTELLAAFPGISRKLSVERTLPASERRSRALQRVTVSAKVTG